MLRFSIIESTEFSTKPKELLDSPIIILSEITEESLKALFVNAVLLTVNGSKLVGSPITLLTYAALISAANNGARYFESKLLLSTK